MGLLYEAIGGSPPPFDAGKADHDYRDLKSRLEGDPDLRGLSEILDGSKALSALLHSIFSSSPYLTGLILRDPHALLEMLNADSESAVGNYLESLEAALKSCTSIKDAQAALRQFKRRIALLLAIKDIGEIAEVDEIVADLSVCAAAALNGALRFLLSEAAKAGDYFPVDIEKVERDSGYIILGLGKLGAYELNYSSDIDIIVFYEAGRANLREGVGEQQFFIRITRDLVTLMQEITGDGYVFRTDLRLRPDPGATQVALSTQAALIYYESFGQNWERAAMIKARAVAGDVSAGDAFLAELAPFVWRKYLDFAAIADVHAMKRQIHAVKGHSKIALKGHDLKLGRGGIREIEFFAQTQQLIAGGRQHNLRVRSTLEALDELVRSDWIEGETAKELKEAYLFLRRVEHRLQMIADEQTHSLPADEEALLRVARFSGFETLDDFEAALTRRLEVVQGHYGALFEDVPRLSSDCGNLVFTGDEDDPDTVATLKSMGFDQPSQVICTFKNWHFGRYPATRSERARERLTELHPDLLAALADTANPDAALIEFDRFLSDLPAGIQLFSLLRNNPRLLSLIAGIMGTAPRLATVLSRRATLLDAVLDPGFFGTLPNVEELRAIVDESLEDCEHYQDCLDLARDIGQEQAFLIGVRVLSGTAPASEAGGAFAQLAERLIHSLKCKVDQEMTDAHGSVPGGEVAVVAMGKLGGEEMTASSDLDLIVIYDFDKSASQSDGDRPLSISQYYARYTQRLISALTAPTARGELYEVDMRLRPSGNSGPVASSFESFSDYQLSKAWTWEHMALTRARVVSGTPGLEAKLNDLIHDVLRRSRDKAQIVQDVLDMRQKIRDTRGALGIWNMKHVRGGLLDIEFIAQYLQLIHASNVPQILNRNTICAVQNLREEAILSQSQAETLIEAARLYSNLTQILRLCFEGRFDPEKAPQGLKMLLAKVAEVPDFSRLEMRLGDCEEAVGRIFDEIIGPTSG